MRLVCLAVVFCGFAVMALSAVPASAAPAPGVTAGVDSGQLVEKAGYWRRYWRRNGYPPDAAPGLAPDSEIVVGEDGPILVPLRPASCGQYRYWNGEFCADARSRPPYIFPRW